MSAQQQQVPIVLLKEGTSETKGNQAQKNNIMAAKTIAQIGRVTLRIAKDKVVSETAVTSEVRV